MSLNTNYCRPECPDSVESAIQNSIKSQLAYADRLVWELTTPKFWKGWHDPTHPRFDTP